MIQGNKRDYIDVDDLLYYTSDGREIYEYYLGKKINSSSIMKRPWGDDSHPSFGVFYKNNSWLWKDQANEENGNAITFVQKLFDLSFPEAIDKIRGDFGLDDKKVIKERSYIKQEEEPKKYAHITAVSKRFNKEHHAFWNCVEVTEDWCKKFDCFAVKKLFINRTEVILGQNEVVFVYLAEDINKVKVYFPERKDIRFRTNAPGDYLWEYHKLKEKVGKLPIHKSMKDLITFAQIYPHNIATQNESIKQFNPDVVNKINSIATEPWLFYGSDMDGVKKCTQVTESNKWKYINTPSWMLPETNDVYSFTKKLGLKTLEQYCKYKKLI